MITCRICKRDKDIWDPDDNICKECWYKERQQNVILSAYKRTKRHKHIEPDERLETPTKQSEHLLQYSEWAIEQVSLAKNLGLHGAARVVGRMCAVCGQPVPKYSHLDLCPEHRDQYRRWIHRQDQAKYRKKMKVKGVSI